MYWSAHVGTQENNCHDVMKNATQSSNNISHDPIATAIGNKIITEKRGIAIFIHKGDKKTRRSFMFIHQMAEPRWTTSSGSGCMLIRFDRGR